MAKGTYEMLPGCATVVLETVLALQSYANSRRDPRRKKASFFAEDGRIAASTKSMCTAVAKLTQWADRVIMDGCVDPTEDYANQIIDPVRVAVNALAANLLAVSVVVPRSTSLHNSLPDLASPDREDKKLFGGQAPDSTDFVRERGRPPPLPPKSKSQSHSDDSVDHTEAVTTSTANVDWFSNPLFERRSGSRSRSKKHRNSSSRMPGSESSSFENNSKTTSSELDTTLPDFCKPQRMSVCEQTSVSYIDVSPNISRDSFDFDHLIGPLATSSPRAPAVAALSTSASASFARQDQYPDNTSSSTSSDIPPALPRKARQPAPPPLPPVVNPRKISTYDNVAMPQSAIVTTTTSAFPTFRVYQRSLTSDSSDATGEAGLFGELAAPILPPPLPPKKKHIMSYMEMFGRSLVNSGKFFD